MQLFDIVYDPGCISLSRGFFFWFHHESRFLPARYVRCGAQADPYFTLCVSVCVQLCMCSTTFVPTSWGYICLTSCFLCHHPCLYCILPCLHLVWMLFGIVIPTYLQGKVFCLVSVNFFGSLIFSENRQLHAANGETRVNSTPFSRLWRKHRRSRLPTEKSVRSGVPY